MTIPKNGEMTKHHRLRKPRRLTLKQAVACELGLSKPYSKAGVKGGVYRCRCAGKLRGRGLCNPDPAKATRWDFALLAPSDPHYIPPMRRRVSPRRAVQMLKDAAERIGAVASAAAKQANTLLLAARQKLDAVVAAERIYSRVRRFRNRILDGVLPAPCEFLDRVQNWLDRRAKYPPGSAPAWFADACTLGMASLLNVKREILGQADPVPLIPDVRGRTTDEHRQLRLLLGN